MLQNKLLIVVFLGLFSVLRGVEVYAGENHPQRIISFSPVITEELYILGVEDRLVGCTVYCQRPSQAKTKERVGTVIDANIEKIVSLRPDLVLATPLLSPKAREKLKDLGIEVIVFPAAKSFRQICGQFLQLGRIVGEEEKANGVVAGAKSEAAGISRQSKGQLKPKVFAQIGARPLFAAAGDTFIDDLIEIAGGINVAGSAHSGIYSREKVLEDNPDVILIVTMGDIGEREKKIWQRYKALKAVQQDRIYIIDAYRLCSPTPLSFVESLSQIAEILRQ